MAFTKIMLLGRYYSDETTNIFMFGGFMKLIYALVFLLYFIFGIQNGYCNDFITSDILQRVFYTSYGGSTFTSFTIEVNKEQYLISARHCFPNISENSTIEIKIFHEEKWKILKVKIFFPDDNDVDIAIMKPDMILSAFFETKCDTTNLIFSQDVFFLGFPYGLFTDDIDNKTNRGFPIPFIKKGIISAMERGDKIIYLDGDNNKGFSGGPVACMDYSTKKFKIISVISGYKSFNGNIKYIDAQKVIKDDPNYIYQENLGIIISFSIVPAVKKINKIQNK